MTRPLPIGFTDLSREAWWRRPGATAPELAREMNAIIDARAAQGYGGQCWQRPLPRPHPHWDKAPKAFEPLSQYDELTGAQKLALKMAAEYTRKRGMLTYTHIGYERIIPTKRPRFRIWRKANGWIGWAVERFTRQRGAWDDPAYVAEAIRELLRWKELGITPFMEGIGEHNKGGYWFARNFNQAYGWAPVQVIWAYAENSTLNRSTLFEGVSNSQTRPAMGDLEWLYGRLMAGLFAPMTLKNKTDPPALYVAVSQASAHLIDTKLFASLVTDHNVGLICLNGGPRLALFERVAQIDRAAREADAARTATTTPATPEQKS